MREHDRIPAYVDMKRLCEELGRSDETIRRWQKRHGFPVPKKFGLFEWKEVEAFMDGRTKRKVDSRPVDQLQEIQHAHAAYTQGRSH